MPELQPPYNFRREPLELLVVPDELDGRRKRLAGVAITGELPGVHRDPWAEVGFMLPFDEPEEARDYLRSGKSTCGLTGKGYVTLLGSDHRVLLAPYLPRDGQAIADLVLVARDGGAWRTPEPQGLEPLAGDVILIGHMLHDGSPDPAYVRGTRATEHIVIMTGRDGQLLESVEGGQPGVERRTRRVVRVGRELWLAHTEHGVGPDGRPLVGRRVVGWLSVGDLPLPLEAYVPEKADLTG